MSTIHSHMVVSFRLIATTTTVLINPTLGVETLSSTKQKLLYLRHKRTFLWKLMIMKSSWETGTFVFSTYKREIWLPKNKEWKRWKKKNFISFRSKLVRNVIYTSLLQLIRVKTDNYRKKRPSQYCIGRNWEVKQVVSTRFREAHHLLHNLKKL